MTLSSGHAGPQPGGGGGGGGGGGQNQLFTFSNLLSKLMEKCMPKLVLSTFQTSHSLFETGSRSIICDQPQVSTQGSWVTWFTSAIFGKCWLKLFDD